MMKFIRLLYYACCILFFVSMIPHSPAESWLKEGEKLLMKGDFSQCISQAGDYLQEELSSENRCDTLLIRAISYQHKGLLQKAYTDLLEARKIAENLDVARNIECEIRISDLYLSIGRIDEAKAISEELHLKIPDIKDKKIHASILNNWGNILAVTLEYEEDVLEEEMRNISIYDPKLMIAKRGVKVVSRRKLEDIREEKNKVIQAYDKSAELALKAKSYSLAVRSILNRGNEALEIGNQDLSIKSLRQAGDIIKKMPKNFEEGFLYLSLGIFAFHVNKKFSTSYESDLNLFAWEAFNQAFTSGKKIDNSILKSLAKGYMGKLYEHNGNFDDAIELTHSAIFFAYQDVHPEFLYRWQWQLGRLLNKKGDEEGAIFEYEQAVASLETICNELSVGYRKIPDIFSKRVKPVYYELADLYIKKADRLSGEMEQKEILAIARQTIENMKSAELQNYFQDECITVLEKKTVSLDDIAADSAVLYPLMLSDRLVVLLTLPDGIHHYVSYVNGAEFQKTVRRYREDLQTDNKSEVYKQDAKKIYDWIIKPLESSLQSYDIKTLIVVPDGVLNLIPFSTLFDGEKFLVEKYALAVTPSLQLLESETMDRRKMESIIFGLSEAVKNYPALPAVDEELEAVAAILGGEVFANKNFTVDRVLQKLKTKNYRVIHMATHGEFNRDPEKTFLLTHDKRITLNELERIIKFSKFREEPLELLTLSACQTAVGDERAVLGLAGVAVKSGARSVLASLWFVSDQATKELVTEFYRQYFGNDMLSKAEALQNAQKKLLATTTFRHPSQWAPFLLIGNWL